MDGKLRIGIDARAAAEEPAGRGRYVRELLRAFSAGPYEHEFVAYGRATWDCDVEWRLIAAPDPLWHLRAALAASRECDVFLSTNSWLTAWFTRIPTVPVAHDMVPWMPEMNPQRRAALIERATIRPALRRAAAVICVSESTERDLLERFPAAAGKTAVVHHGVSSELDRIPDPAELEDVRDRLRLPREFILATGTLEPRKNLPRLIEAHSGLPGAPELLLAGPRGWELERALEGASGRARLLGYVSDTDLAALYRTCTVFAYPSLYEGFGLPLAEAMRCGAACLAARSSSLPEVGGDAVVYADPLDPGSLRAALAGLLESPAERAALGERARERAQRFTWEAAAAGTIEVLEAAAARPRAAAHAPTRS
jgi:glycosyltransferase involved in cell wall biosynthesis